jgi:hypothetical protein
LFRGKSGDFRQARHRDLSKPRAEAIEPALDADRSDQKIANRGVVSPCRQTRGISVGIITLPVIIFMK